MKQQADRERKEAEEWKKGDRVMLNTKNLVFKEMPVKKLVDKYVGSYFMEDRLLLDVGLDNTTVEDRLLLRLDLHMTRIKR